MRSLPSREGTRVERFKVSSRVLCGIIVDMENHTNGHSATNGKSTQHSLVTVTIPTVSERQTKRSHKLDRLLNLTKETLELEMQFKDKVKELETELALVGEHDLPTVLMSLTRPRGPGLRKAAAVEPEPSPPWVDDSTLKGRIAMLMSDGRERKSSAIIKALKAKHVKSSVYHGLKELVISGYLVKPAHGYYRKA